MKRRSTGERAVREPRRRGLYLGVAAPLLAVILLGAAFGSTALSAAASDQTITVEDTESGVQITRVWTKTAGDAKGPIRAGDVLQFHTAVTNKGPHTWTAANPLRFEDDLAGLLDDAVLTGARQGTSASSCAPTVWSIACGTVLSASVDGTLTHQFALRPGASHYFNHRVTVRNDFLTGDLRLIDAAELSAVVHETTPGVVLKAELAADITPQHPDLAIVDQRVTKVAGDAKGPIRAGDVLQYHVAVQNTGEGDWTVKSAWADEKLAVFETDLSDLLDDAVLVGARQGVSASSCAPAAWSIGCDTWRETDGGGLAHAFALKAGAKHYFNFRVQITNDFLGGDQDLLNTVTVSGDPGNEQPRAEASGDLAREVVVQHPDLAIVDQRVTKVAGDAKGPIRAGDVLQYHVAVQNTGEGDWTAKSAWADEKLAVFETDLSDLLDDAVLVGARQGVSASSCAPAAWSIGCDTWRETDGGGLAHAFALKAGAKHYFNFRVQITNDFLGGDQDLLNTVTVSGDPGNEQPPVKKAGDFVDTVLAQHPDLQIVAQEWNKVTGDSAGPIRAGDVLQYHVAVQNTGDGDWTAGSTWAQDKRASFTTDLSDLFDDAVFIGAREGTSASSCAPTAWSIGCETLPLTDGTGLEHDFALKADAIHYFNFRVQMTNAYTGDELLLNQACAFGEPGNAASRVEVCADIDTELAVQFPELALEQSWKKISGSADEKARAGDVIEYSVKVTNPGDGDWTAGSTWAQEKLVAFTADVGDVLDDAVWLQGSPDACYTSGCERLDAPVAGKIDYSFPLKAGASRTITYRVQVSDAFTGDELLSTTACVIGDTRGPAGVLTDCDSSEIAMLEQYPDAAIRMEYAKSPRPTEAVRAGDRVTYTITLTNTGEGDWNVPSAWAVGNPLTLTEDLADILDDSSVTGTIAGGAVIEGGALRWSGALAAGKTKIFSFTVIVGSQAAGTATDLLLKGDACATGDTRDPGVDPSEITRCAALELSIGERWSMTKKVFDAQGSELLDSAVVRPGAALTYEIAASSVGGWPVAGAVLKDDLSRVLDVAAVQGDIVFQIGDGAEQILKIVDGRVVTPRFELPAQGAATITYRVKVPDDVHSGRLHNVATGEVRADDGSVIAPQGCGTESRPCETSHRIHTPAPTIEKTMTPGGPVERGDTVSYTVRVTNPGPGAWSERNPLSIVDDLNRVLDDADLVGSAGVEVAVSTSSDPTAGAVAVVDGRISWSGTLGAGEWIELRYSVVVHAVPAGGDRVLVNEACTGAPGAERICDVTRGTIPKSSVEIERPQWGEGDAGCVAPPWIELPITPGVVYTMAGKVEPGGSVTVTATPAPGYELVVPDGWTLAADGATASFTVHFPTCESRLIAYPDVNYRQAWCNADGTITPPSFELVETEGIEYSYVGDALVGEGIVVTATAKPGYTLGVLSSSKNWKLSADRLTATLTITFIVPDCGEGGPGWNGIAPEPPHWSGPTCEAPDAEPSLTLPETEGLVYSIDGEVKIGSTVVVTVVAADGSKLGYHRHWKYSADRKSATWSVTFSAPTGCDTGADGGGDTENPDGDADGSGGPNGEGGSDGGEGGTGGENPDPEPSEEIDVPPLPAIPEAVCVDGVAVMPDLKVILVPGVWYDIQGEATPGGTVVLTAHTLPGYILEDTTEWMTGDWVVAADRRSATQTITFPGLDELCSLGENPDDQDRPGQPGGPDEGSNPDSMGVDGASDAESTGASGNGALATTGSPGGSASVLAGTVLLIVGSLALFARRRIPLSHE